MKSIRVSIKKNDFATNPFFNMFHKGLHSTYVLDRWMLSDKYKIIIKLYILQRSQEPNSLTNSVQTPYKRHLTDVLSATTIYCKASTMMFGLCHAKLLGS